jgi:hypothetical protein
MTPGIGPSIRTPSRSSATAERITAARPKAGANASEVVPRPSAARDHPRPTSDSATRTTAPTGGTAHGQNGRSGSGGGPSMATSPPGPVVREGGSITTMSGPRGIPNRRAGRSPTGSKASSTKAYGRPPAATTSAR